MHKCLIIMLSALLITSCSLRPVRAENLNTYTLTAPSITQANVKQSSFTVFVSNTVAAPGYQTSAMIYAINPYQLHRFAKNRWVAPPAQLLTAAIEQSLRGTHYFKAVTMPPFAGLTDLRLDTQLIKLQQNFLGNKSEIDLVLQAQLMNNKTNKVIAGKTFSTIVPAEATPYGGVVASNQAVAIILQQLTQWMLNQVCVIK